MVDLCHMTARAYVSVQFVNKSTWIVEASEKTAVYSYEGVDSFFVMVVRGGKKGEHTFPKRNVVHFETQSPI